jgi:DNA-binding cell septation regulator SpoVG
MEIKIREMKRLTKGSLRAMVDVEVGGLLVRGLHVIDNGKGAWIAWPSKKWIGRDGQVRYSNIVEPRTSELREAIAGEVMRAWREQPQ